VHAVCRLLRRSAYTRVTVSVVARELEVDPALIRYYFRDHASLMEAATVALTEEFRVRALAAAARSDGTPLGMLRARIAALLETGRQNRFVLRLLLDVATENPRPEMQRTLRALTGEGVQYYDRLLAAGVAAGQMRRLEPVFLAIAVLSIADAFSIQEPIFAAGRRLGIRSTTVLRARYQQFMIELLVNGVKAR
jgi:AcrR family transcriptional regulator